MRQIIFRAHDAEDGGWVYGNYHRYLNGIEAICDTDADWYMIDPQTIGQYTGMKDKTGTMIYEGDIIQFGEYTAVINFKSYCFCANTTSLYFLNRNNPALDVIENEYPNSIEVIGNIHDNPELID